MKAINSLLVFLICGFTLNVALLNANTQTEIQRTILEPSLEPTTRLDASAVVQHFWFEYKGQPEPGRRVWVRVDDSTWAELYPNGSLSHFKMEKRTSVLGMSGLIVRKVGGDPNQTWTLNDGSSEVFIPDKDSGRLILAFRNYGNGKWTDWKPFAIIHPIH